MSSAPQQLESFPDFLARNLRAHRLLLIVFTATAAVGAWEFFHSQSEVDLQLAEPQNFTDVMADLYPDDAGVQYMKARQLTMCLEAIRRGKTPPSPCAQFADLDPVETARAFYEHGMRRGKHIEDLYYDYALFLIFTGADDTEIATACEEWKARFPLSERPDPREAHASAARQLGER